MAIIAAAARQSLDDHLSDPKPTPRNRLMHEHWHSSGVGPILVSDILEDQKLFTHAEHATGIEDTKTSQHRLHGVRLDLKGRE